MPGAYALKILLSKPAALPPRFAGSLPAGTYLYLGSAYGPGGIQARCRRHLASQKSVRWNVDWLTSQAVRIEVLAFPEGSECALVAAAQAAGAEVPIPGFGSSDCQVCRSHLLLWPKAVIQWPQQG